MCMGMKSFGARIDRCLFGFLGGIVATAGIYLFKERSDSAVDKHLAAESSSYRFLQLADPDAPICLSRLCFASSINLNLVSKFY